MGDRILEVNHNTLLNLAHADVIAYLKEPVEVMILKIRREAPSLDEQLRSTMIHASASAARLAPVPAAVPVQGAYSLCNARRLVVILLLAPQLRLLPCRPRWRPLRHKPTRANPPHRPGPGTGFWTLSTGAAPPPHTPHRCVSHMAMDRVFSGCYCVALDSLNKQHGPWHGAAVAWGGCCMWWLLVIPHLCCEQAAQAEAEEDASSAAGSTASSVAGDGKKKKKRFGMFGRKK